MPYYRIIIWTNERRKPYQGIRQIENYNIDNVFKMIEKDVYSKFPDNSVIDYEIQMLPKNCTAVKKHLQQVYKKASKR